MSKKSKNKRIQSLINLGLFIGIAIFVNVLGNAIYGILDLTEEKRFTLTTPTKNLLNELDDVVYVQILLDGEFPAGFKRLRRSVIELLEDFRSQSGYIEYEIINPMIGSAQEIKQTQEELAKDGIIPTNLTVKGLEGREEKLIYPWAKVHYKGRVAAVDLLDEQAAGGQEHQLNASVAALEYNLANAIQKLDRGSRDIVAFTEGHGELDALERKDLVKNLRSFFSVGVFKISDAPFIPVDTVKVLIVAKPTQPFSEKDKFKIDQYVMNGGKVIWLIDPLAVGLDSMRRVPTYLAPEYNLNIEDLLFKYGIRIDYNYVLDLQASQIPLVVDRTGRQELFPWYYHPIVVPDSKHPIAKNLDGVYLEFPATIDPNIRTKTKLKKTVLLHSSNNARTQPNVTQLTFDILRTEVNPDQYNKPNLPIAMVLEGVFHSNYANRVSDEMHAGLNQMGRPFKTESKSTRMLVVADGDIARNKIISRKEEKTHPLGYIPFDRYQYANKTFLLNAVEYLLDDSGLIEARSKDIKLRLLDKARAEKEKTKWQLINILLPLIFLGIFGFLFNYLRKRKYG